MKHILALALVSVFTAAAFSQKLVSPVVGGYRVPDDDLIRIVKAEDHRDPAPVNAMFTNVNTATRYRAALAAGRIGAKDSLDGLAALLQDRDVDVRAMAAFAIGEVESIQGADAILKALDEQATSMKVVARAVEAAGKIAAANSKDPKAKELGKAILDTLVRQSNMQANRDRDVTLLALTAVLRARPDGAADVVARSLRDSDPRVRADAGNTLTRLRAKNVNSLARSMLRTEPDGTARANAARILGAAEDKEAAALLRDTAVGDSDARVRVAAIRSLGALKEPIVVNTLIERMRILLRAYSSKARNPSERTELLEIATALSRILEKTEDERAIDILSELRDRDGYSSAETEIAFAHMAPKAYVTGIAAPTSAYREWRQAAAYGQGLGDVASTKDEALIAQAGQKLTAFIAGMASGVRPADRAKMLLAMPDLTNAMAALKPANLDEILRGQLANEDAFIRAAAAGAMADQSMTKANVDALVAAFTKARLTDKHDNDAKLAIMDAIAKLDKRSGVGGFLMALDDPDYLVRKKAFDILDDEELQKAFPGIPASLANARDKHKDQVLAHSQISGTFLGQVLNKDADYRRALSRKNGSISAVLTTEKGTFTIRFNPEEAPLTVDNFVNLARRGYFKGLTVHRVVANFVMQDGDPRGDGNGGPGLSIRCEINTLPYDRGAVGMALSGKDTGGSQWFVTHSPQPHLDGGYTVFGHVSEADMKVVDNIVRGDKILRVRVVGR